VDQTIGIGYQVDGVQQVVEANKHVIASFEAVANKLVGVGTSVTGAIAPIMNFAKGLSALGNAAASIKDLGVKGAKLGDFFKGSSSMGTAARNAELFNKAITDTPAKASAAASALGALSTAVERYNVAMGTAKGYQIAPMKVNKAGEPIPFQQPGGGGSGRKPKMAPDDTGNFLMDSIWGKAPWFLLRYRMWSAGIQAAQYGATDIGLGRSRQKMAHSLGELSPLGFDQNLKKDTEFAAKMFSQKFWTVSAESYIQAMTQTASAFDVSAIGFGNMQKMNEASIKVSMISKMSVEKTAELMTKTMLAFMTKLPEEVSRQLQSGGKADVKGFGNVDIGGLSQGIAAQIGKTIAVSAIWGPGIQSAFRYILPSVLDRGWSMPASLALVAATSDLGFQPGQSGRGAKDLFEGEGDPFAQMIMKRTGLWRDTKGLNLTPEQKKLNKDHNTQYMNAIRSKLVNKYMGDEDIAPDFLKAMGGIMKDLEAEGFNIVKEFGVSKNWIPLIRSVTSEGFATRYKEMKDKIANSVDADLTKTVLETLLDAGTAYERVSTSLQNFSTTISDWPGAHIIAKAISGPFNYATTLMSTQRAVARDQWSPSKVHDWIREHQEHLISEFGVAETEMLRERMIETAKTGKTSGWLAPTVLSLAKDLGNTTMDIVEWFGGGIADIAKSFWNELKVKPKPGRFNDFLERPLWTRPEAIKGGIYDTVTGIGNLLAPIWDSISGSAMTTWDSGTLWQSLGDFWNNSIIGPLKEAGATWDMYAQQVYAAIDYLPNKIVELIGDIGSAIDSIKAKVAPYIPKFETPPGASPAPEGFNDMSLSERMAVPFMSYGGAGQGAPQITLTSQIENRLQLDGRVIAQVVADIIQKNRDVNYHGYGGDPMGFVT